jgi:tetratricopeptide (TPR) repeat protein
MQAAAITSRFLTGFSSKAGLADSEIVVSHGRLIQHIVASHLAQTVHSHETFLTLANTLIHSAEQVYMLRNVDALEEVSSVLMNLPIDGARQIGLYYYALAINRKGQRDEAEALLEAVANKAPITYRARAIQTLGGNCHDKGQLDEAARFQFEALRLASDQNAHGLQTTLLAHLEISHLKSDKGDHKGALGVLESISPLVQTVARRNPLYFYFYHNELAVEFAELDCVAEAEAASAVALASPFATAYPEWSETRDEIAAKRASATPSVIGINRPPEAKPSPQIEQQRQPKRSRKFSSSQPASSRRSFQGSIIPIPATATIPFNAISVLNRMLICIGPRAPPFVSESISN